MTTKEMIAVMQGYEEGKEIQYRSKGNIEPIWQNASNPCWDWYKFDYRIKPEEVKHKYKVGDYVLVLDGSNIPNYAGDWARSMSNYVGKIFPIKALRKWDGRPCYYLDGGVPCLYFDERGLALVKIGE